MTEENNNQDGDPAPTMMETSTATSTSTESSAQQPPSSHDNQRQQHELTEKQLQAIENEIKSTQPLTSICLPLSALVQQYTSSCTSNNNDDNNNCSDAAGGDGFLKSAHFLSKKYSHLRRVRGDGNCYYRSFLYALCESLLRHLTTYTANRTASNDATTTAPNDGTIEFQRVKQLVSNSMQWVL